MSKYDRLGEFLRKQSVERVPMSFADIERITAATLPASAHKHRPWWSNNPTNSVMTRVWLDAGFESEQVDMTGQRLVFRRVTNPASKLKELSRAVSEGASNHPLHGALKGMTKVAPGVDLTKPADPSWAEPD
ncbi:hypothetical protein [Tardiphaga sp.]|uniref:DUF7662 domain-containing protein n=1 Tax=Tardiphaga sp. TaxID=1926292 RepID=UPI00352A73AB